MYRFSVDHTGCWMYEYEVDDKLIWKAIETTKTDDTIKYHSDTCLTIHRNQDCEIICIEDPHDIPNDYIR